MRQSTGRPGAALMTSTMLALALAACHATDPSGPAAATLAKSGVTDTAIAAPESGEWLSYGRDYSEQRFSPLTQISSDSVGQLGLAWSADLETARGQEATPLMHNGTLYVSTAWSMVKAYDAATGKAKWSYDPKVPRDTLARACRPGYGTAAASTRQRRASSAGP
eukprot:gene4996-6780_t